LAANILSEHGCQDAVPALSEVLSSGDFFLKGECMLALVKLKHTDSYSKIINIFLQAKNPRVAIMGAIALRRMQLPKATAALFKKLRQPNLKPVIRNEILVCLAEKAGIGMSFYRLVRAWYRNADKADKTALVIDYLESIIRPLSPELRLLATGYCSGAVPPAVTKDTLLELLSACKDNEICQQAAGFVRECDSLFERSVILLLGFAVRHYQPPPAEQKNI
jgi:hypothetical protein